MKDYDISELRGFLEKVRGETRVKAKEEGIRNQFLQSAVEEIFEEHDWVFNRRIESELTINEEGYYEAPTDFSIFNNYYIKTATRTYEKKDGGIEVLQDGETTLLAGPTDTTVTLVYYIVAPNLLESGTRVRFPRPMLIAERAYVRLKTAYFPDETSEKEEARSLRMVRDLAMRDTPRPSFKLKSWR